MVSDELSHEKVQAQIRKLMDESIKIQAETSKINKENHYYVAVLSVSATLAVVAIVKLFL